MRLSRAALLAVLLCLAAFAAAAVFSRTVFDRLPHLEDELTYLFQARVFARGQVTAPTPDPVGAYWQPFVITDDGQRFGKYPPGWPALLAAGVWMGQPWWVNAGLAALTVALTYRLGRDVFGVQAGLLAAALVTFSPMLLLLNATLMGHTAALTLTTLFLWAYWRLARAQHPWRWGLVAGLALGLNAASRPLTAVAISLPLVLYSGARLLLALRRRKAFWATLRPLLALGTATIVVALAHPLYNFATTGNARANLYTRVWAYDRVGFGPEVGRSGHTLEKGLRHTGWDLSLLAADLFGWQIGVFDDALRQHALTAGSQWPRQGLSFVLLPFGVAAGLLGWRRTRWPWLLVLAGVPLVLIGAYVAYWIGAQRYSTRYYSEAASALALIAALGPAWLAQRGRGWAWGVAAVTVFALAWSLLAYSVPRIGLLHAFNNVSAAQVAALQARRTSDAPVLVLVTGERRQTTSWRAYGTAMVLTGSFLDSDVVAALDNGAPGRREAILAAFPDREVIEMRADGAVGWYADEPRPTPAR